MSKHIIYHDGRTEELEVGRPEGPEIQAREHEVLIAMVRALQPAIAVEIGSLYGNFLAPLTWNMKQWDGRVYSLDLHIDWSRPYLEAWGLLDRITFIEGDSKETVGQLPNGIGFAFIDANHAYECAKGDYEGVWPKMSEGGIVAFHDVYLSTDANDWLKFGPSPVRQYIRDAHPYAIHIPWGQGICVVQKPFASSVLDPNASGRATI